MPRTPNLELSDHQVYSKLAFLTSEPIDTLKTKYACLVPTNTGWMVLAVDVSLLGEKDPIGYIISANPQERLREVEVIPDGEVKESRVFRINRGGRKHAQILRIKI